MPDVLKPRAVSGEIKAGAADTDDLRGPQQVIDADYVSLPPEPPAPEDALRGVGERPAAIGSTASPSGGMDSLRRHDAPSPASQRGGVLFWSVGALLVLAAFWISGGHALLLHVPLFGAQEPASALRIAGVTSRVDVSGVRPILLIDGEVANDGKVTQPLPPLEIVVAGNDGLVMRYRLGTSGRPLPPGETFAFSSRFDAPMNGVKTVSVAFAE